MPIALELLPIAQSCRSFSMLFFIRFTLKNTFSRGIRFGKIYRYAPDIQHLLLYPYSDITVKTDWPI